MIYELMLSDLKSSFKRAYELKLSDLLETAPSDASISSSIQKIRDGYEGILNIFSSQGKFMAKAISNDPGETVQSLVGQIQNQLRTWRNARFTSASIC